MTISVALVGSVMIPVTIAMSWMVMMITIVPRMVVVSVIVTATIAVMGTGMHVLVAVLNLVAELIKVEVVS